MVDNTDEPDWEKGIPAGYEVAAQLHKRKRYTNKLSKKYMNGRAGSNFMYQNLHNYAQT
jgi:hypothetical protein